MVDAGSIPPIRVAPMARAMCWGALITLAVAALGFVACGESEDAISTASSDTSTASETSTTSKEPGEISASEYGKKWPLTVDSGVVRCEGSGAAGEVIFTAPDGTEYAVNGTAQANYPPIDPIWRYDPELKKYEIKVSMGPVLDTGLALCE